MRFVGSRLNCISLMPRPLFYIWHVAIAMSAFEMLAAFMKYNDNFVALYSIYIYQIYYSMIIMSILFLCQSCCHYLYVSLMSKPPWYVPGMLSGHDMLLLHSLQTSKECHMLLS